MKFTFQDCANPAFLHSHPKYFWGFYGYRLDMYRKITPHSGFKHLLDICKMGNIKDSFVVTSNVDGHFQKAGFNEKKVYEIHGSIHHMQCNNCYSIVKADDYEVAYDPESFEAKEPLPACKSCKSLVRPNILMFGDWEFDGTRSDGQGSLYHDFVNRLTSKDRMVILEFGAGHAVPTIRSIGEQLLRNKKCETFLVRVNLRDFDPPYSKTNIDHFLAFPEKALSFMEELMKYLK